MLQPRCAHIHTSVPFCQAKSLGDDERPQTVELQQELDTGEVPEPLRQTRGSLPRRYQRALLGGLSLLSVCNGAGCAARRAAAGAAAVRDS